MAINKATLAKKINNVIEYVYPKTSADIVIYDSNYSVGSIIDRLISTKVDKEDGKGLSTNDFNNVYKDRLDSFDEYAIDSALSPTSINSVENRAIYAGLMEVKNELKEDIANITDEEILQETIEAIREIQDLISNDTSGGIISDINSLKTTVGNSSNGLVKDVNSLKTTVGDSSNGVVKDVTSLKTTVGNSSSGLVKDVNSLKTTMGDSSSGVVKDIASLKTTVGNSSNGMVKDVTSLKTTVGNYSDAGLINGTTLWSVVNFFKAYYNGKYDIDQIIASHELANIINPNFEEMSYINYAIGTIKILAKIGNPASWQSQTVGKIINYKGIKLDSNGVSFWSSNTEDQDIATPSELFTIDDNDNDNHYIISITGTIFV